jgi:hypothetical protein
MTEYRIRTVVKTMDDYIPILENQRYAAVALAQLCARRIVYDGTGVGVDGEGTLLVYNEELRQWRTSNHRIVYILETKPRRYLVHLQ